MTKTTSVRRAALPVIALAAGAVVAFKARASLFAGPVGNPTVPQPARTVDLARYVGLWYELGRYDNLFERGMEGVTAEYRARSDGLIQVINTGRKGGPNGRPQVGVGKAKVVKDSGDAKLKVSFLGPLYFGNYWVLDHDPDYAWSIVGEPSGRFLWLLCRQARPPEAVREQIWSRARALGYDTAMIKATVQ
jgi:apolipoprotein D and lipocalin family protein